MVDVIWKGRIEETEVVIETRGCFGQRSGNVAWPRNPDATVLGDPRVQQAPLR